MILPTPLCAGPKDWRVFGETPKTAVETTALPKATASFRLSHDQAISIRGGVMMARIRWSMGFLTLAFLTDAQAQTIRNDLISVTVNQGRYAIQAQGQAAPFASGSLRHQGVVKAGAVKDSVFGEG